MMKKILGVLAFASIGLLQPLHAETVTIRADEWCPYNCAPGSEKPGYMIEIAEAIFEKYDISVDYQTLNWSRAVAETRRGNFDAIVGASIGDAEDFLFPAPLGVAENTYFTISNDNWDFNGMDSLYDRQLGVIQDYDYGEDLNAYIEANSGSRTVQSATGDTPLEINFRKLIAGRLNTVVEVGAVGLGTINDMGLADQVRVAGRDDHLTEVYIAFSPAKESSARYVEMLREGVEELRRTGELDTILARYGLTDWQ